jgi:hypothetical protein
MLDVEADPVEADPSDVEADLVLCNLPILLIL